MKLRDLSAIVFIVLTLAGCASSRSLVEAPRSVEVDCRIPAVTPRAAVSLSAAVFRLPPHRHTGYFTDVCFSDSTVFLLDDTHTVSAFSLADGQMVGQLTAGGIVSIAAVGTYIAMLHSGGRSLSICNTSLQRVAQISLPFEATDFTGVADGYLFCTAAGCDTLRRVVHTDFHGVPTADYIDAHDDARPGHERRFTTNSLGEVFFHEPYSTVVYRWTGKTMAKAFLLDIDGDDDRTAEVLQTLVTPGYLIATLRIGGERMFMVYNRSTAAQVTYTSDDVAAHEPFLPRWIHGSKLVNVYNVDIADDDDSGGNSGSNTGSGTVRMALFGIGGE